MIQTYIYMYTYIFMYTYLGISMFVSIYILNQYLPFTPFTADLSICRSKPG